MAGESHFLSQLQPQLAGVDDAALAALASVGLLRRARKDLESLQPVVRTDAAGLVVELGKESVRFDERGPTHAQCTCRSKTTCQHVLAAWLYLRTLPAEAATNTAAQTPTTELLLRELLGVDVAMLVSFAGLPAVREVAAAVERDPLPEITWEPRLTIRLKHPPIELIYAGGGLDAFILEYRGKRRQRLIVQAVLALQRANGAPPPELPAPRASAKAAVPERAPPVLLAAIQSTLAECIEVGLPHLSENRVERLLSYSAAAAGAGLHRLSLALARLAQHIDLQLGRSAASSTAVLLDELANTYALTTAIGAAGTPNPALWGTARSEFEQVARLDLVGVAAELWQTPSGYSGLTVLLWSQAQARWYSVTEARPVGTPGFDPVHQYRAASPWDGRNSLSSLCGATVRLSSASTNRFGRLSAAERTGAQMGLLSAWPDFGAREFTSWERLREFARADPGGVGLAEVDPHSQYVVLRPRTWVEATFDPTRQELSRVVLDDAQVPIRLCLGYSSLTVHAIKRLETVRVASGTRLLGRAHRAAGEVFVTPIALLLQEEAGCRTDNLALDPPPQTSVLTRLTEVLQGLTRPAAGGISARRSATESRMSALEAELLRLAEKGLSGAPPERGRLDVLLESLQAAGLELPPGPSEGPDSISGARVLRLQYSLRLGRQLH